MDTRCSMKLASTRIQFNKKQYSQEMLKNEEKPNKPTDSNGIATLSQYGISNGKF